MTVALVAIDNPEDDPPPWPAIGCRFAEIGLESTRSVDIGAFPSAGARLPLQERRDAVLASRQEQPVCQCRFDLARGATRASHLEISCFRGEDLSAGYVELCRDISPICRRMRP